jgi:hypothetical protein
LSLRASCASSPVPWRGESRREGESAAALRRAARGKRFFRDWRSRDVFRKGKGSPAGEQTWSPRRWRR